MPTPPHSSSARLRSTLLLLAALVALAGCGATVAPNESRPAAATRRDGLIPAAAFFRNPVLSHVTLAPDGSQVAGVIAREGLSVLMVRPTWGGEIRMLAKLDEPGMALQTVGWASNETLLVGVDMPHQSAVGMRARQSRLLAVDLDRSRPRYLGENWPHQEYSQHQDQVIDWLPDDPRHVLINWRQPDQSGVSARRVNVKTGALRTVVPAKPWVVAWFADHEGRVRAGVGTRHSGTSVVVYGRASDADAFAKLVDFDWFEEDGFMYAGFGPEPNVLYVYAPAASGRIGVFEYDLARHALGPLVYADPEFDVGPLVRSPRSGRLLGVEVARERPEIHFIDEAAGREQIALDHALPGTVNRIVSLDRAERIAIVSVSGDVKPPEYYVFDREKKQLDFLFAAYPELDAKSLSPMKAVRYTARDGVEIHGYLTLPVGKEGQVARSEPEASEDQQQVARSEPEASEDQQTALPVIVFPHGGPTERDVWGWDPTVQFLASRGFAVFQPNFRGSHGYGRTHERKGYRQWGLAMQDDITDGVKWLVAEGIADPDRIGIYGADYGGYAALMGLVKTPELFRAGASLAGVTDLIAWLDDREHYQFSDFNKPVVGEQSKDREQLATNSPARLAKRIRAPVLIAHGTDDPIVAVAQAHAMADALEAEDAVEVETLIYRDEVHDFLDERNRIDFHEKLAAFFARHLARRAAPQPARTGATR
jgi:dipeptidyl aminopeptidase/acylaminoacyl peptidase